MHGCRIPIVFEMKTISPTHHLKKWFSNEHHSRPTGTSSSTTKTLVYASCSGCLNTHHALKPTPLENDLAFLLRNFNQITLIHRQAPKPAHARKPANHSDTLIHFQPKKNPRHMHALAVRSGQCAGQVHTEHRPHILSHSEGAGASGSQGCKL